MAERGQIRDYPRSQVGVDVVRESAEDVLKVVPVELVHPSHGLKPSRLSDGAVAIRKACNIHRFDFTAGDHCGARAGRGRSVPPPTLRFRAALFDVQAVQGAKIDR
jgi:hypothetical protein